MFTFTEAKKCYSDKINEINRLNTATERSGDLLIHTIIHIYSKCIFSPRFEPYSTHCIILKNAKKKKHVKELKKVAGTMTTTLGAWPLGCVR